MRAFSKRIFERGSDGLFKQEFYFPGLALSCEPSPFVFLIMLCGGPVKPLTQRQRNQWIAGYLFLLPNLLGFFAFVAVPVLFSLYLAFSRWNLLSGAAGIRFVGLDNFITMASDPWFISSLVNNLVYAFFTVAFSIIIGLFMALLLNNKVFWKGALRTMYFVPYVVSLVAISAIWMAILSRFGPVSQFARFLGIENPPVWLMDPSFAMPAIIALGVWNHAGYCMLIYLAALQGVPKELYEAAEVDGGNARVKFFHVTLPMISPATFLLVITQIIASFRVFAPVQILTQGGPGRSTTVLVYYIYRTAYQNYRMGYASAMAWVMFVLIFLITMIQWRGQKKWVNY